MSEVSRPEFEMLRSSVTANAHRLDAIDHGGTRGVAVVQIQLSDLAKDVARLDSRMDKHEKEHLQEEAERKNSRRWLWTTAIGAVAAIGGLYALVLDVLSHVH